MAPSARATLIHAESLSPKSASSISIDESPRRPLRCTSPRAERGRQLVSDPDIRRDFPSTITYSSPQSIVKPKIALHSLRTPRRGNRRASISGGATFSPSKTLGDIYSYAKPKSPRRSGSTGGRVQSPSLRSKRAHVKEVRRALSNDLGRWGDGADRKGLAANIVASPRRMKRHPPSLFDGIAPPVFLADSQGLSTDDSNHSSASRKQAQTGRRDSICGDPRVSPRKKRENGQTRQQRWTSLSTRGNISSILGSDLGGGKSNSSHGPAPPASARQRRRASCHGNFAPPVEVDVAPLSSPLKQVEKPLKDLYEYLDTNLESDWSDGNELENVNVALRCMNALNRLQTAEKAKQRRRNSAVANLKRLEKETTRSLQVQRRNSAGLYSGNLESALKSLEDSQTFPADESDVATVKKLHSLARQTLERHQSRRSVVSTSTKSTISSVGQDYSIPWWSNAES